MERWLSILPSSLHPYPHPVQGPPDYVSFSKHLNCSGASSVSSVVKWRGIPQASLGVKEACQPIVMSIAALQSAFLHVRYRAVLLFRTHVLPPPHPICSQGRGGPLSSDKQAGTLNAGCSPHLQLFFLPESLLWSRDQAPVSSHPFIHSSGVQRNR